MNIISDFFERIKQCDRMAIIENGKAVSYRELYCYIHIELKRIQNNNLNKVVAIYMENSIEYAIALLAIITSNRIAIPLNFNMTLSELKEMFNKYNVNDIMVHSKRNELDTYNQVTLDIKNMCSENPVNVERVNINENDIILAMPTSGTTSGYKLVPITLINLCYRIKYTNMYYQREHFSKELIILPLSSTIANQQQLFSSLYLTNTLYFYNGVFNPRKFWNCILVNNINYVSITPTLLKILVDNAISKVPRSLLKIFIAGEILEKEIIKRGIILFNTIKFYQAYGMTEMAPIAIQEYGEYYKMGSVGKVIDSTQIKFLEVSKGYYEICVKDKHMVCTYWNGESVRELENGWLHTGDIGYIDDKQYLNIIGRCKNMVIVAGNNVYVEEVETVIRSFPVGDIKVYGISDEITGEALAAEIVLLTGSNYTKEKLLKELSEKLPPYKIPRKIKIVKEIEKNLNGKINRI